MHVNPQLRRRFEDALNFRQPDRAPIWEMLQHPAAFRHFAPGVPFPECAAIACERLGIDATYGFYDVPETEQARAGTVVSGQTVWYTKPAFASLAQVAEPKSVTGCGARMTKGEELQAAAAGWQYDAGLKALVFKQTPGASTGPITVRW